VLSNTLTAGSAIIPFDRDDTNHCVCLNGSWKFCLTNLEQIPTYFVANNFNDKGWSNIPVPANWEMCGFEEPRYYHADTNLAGLYRRSISVSKDWKGQRIFLDLEGVAYGFTVYLDGKEVGSALSAYQPAQFDLTRLIKPGQLQTLALKVFRNHPAHEFDENDDWTLSGVYRDVYLFSTASLFVSGCRLNTSVHPDTGSAELSGEVDLLTTLWDQPRTNVMVEAILRDSTGKEVGRVQQSVLWPGHKIMPTVPFHIALTNAVFWNAEHPALYDLAITLSANDEVKHTFHQRVGFRTVEIRDSVLLVNGQPVKLRGVCRHDIDPVVGRALREGNWLKDLHMMKAANINTVRCTHYPPHPRFLELCDELGFYVLDEIPIGFGEAYQSTPASLGDLLARAQNTLDRDRNHPSVIIWDIGNENPVSTGVQAAGRLAKALDATRPILFPGNAMASGGVDVGGLPAFTDIYAPHYPSTEKLAKMAQDNSIGRPILLTEYNHALDNGFGDLARKWEILQANPQFAGGCIWLWQDQGLKRPINDRKLYDSRKRGAFEQPNGVLCDDRPAETGYIFDGHGIDGNDGIVTADRKAQTDWFQTRAVYCPVIITNRVAAVPDAGQAEVPLTFENRYSFTALYQIGVTWSLLINGKEVSNGSLALRAPPGKTEQVLIKLDLPADTASQSRVLKITMKDWTGLDIGEPTIELQSASGAFDGERNLDALPASGSLVATDNGWRLSSGVEVRLDAKSGLVIKQGDQILVDGLVARVGRPWGMLEPIREQATKYHYWQPHLLPPSSASFTRGVTDQQAARFTVSSLHPSRDKNCAMKVEADCVLDARGWLAVNYTIKPSTNTGNVSELGLGVMTHGKAEGVKWIGDGPWPGLSLKEELDQRGHHEILAGNELFPGNRRKVDLVQLETDPPIGLAAQRADVAWEPLEDGNFFLGQNAFVGDPGNKFTPPDAAGEVAKLGIQRGHFRLLLGKASPAGELLRQTIGQTTAAPEPRN